MTKLILSSAFLLLTLVGCKKDKDPVFPEENPLPDYLAATGFTQKTTNFVNSGDYEFGIKFTPKVKGTIKKIALKIPDNAASVRVTIWDVNTKTAIRTEILTSIVKDIEKLQEITPLPVQAGLTYMITYNGNDWYQRQRTDGATAPYPIKAGELSIDGYAWLSGASQTFPTSLSANYYAGDLSFVFQQAN
jgi:hypothetical protein